LEEVGMQFIKIISNQQTTVWVNTDAIAAIEDGPQMRSARLLLAGGIQYDVMDSADSARIAVITASEGKPSHLMRYEQG
jgi:hypothetical protein